MMNNTNTTGKKAEVVSKNQMIAKIIAAYQTVGLGVTPISGNTTIANMIESYWGMRSDYHVKEDGIHSSDSGDIASWKDEAAYIKSACSSDQIQELYDLAIGLLKAEEV